MPNFPVAAVLRAEPELRAEALVILDGKSPLKTILALSASAAELGITPSMTKAQAELCSELTLRLRSPLQESAAHAALLDCAQSFSPCVEDVAPDTAILDLAGMESLFGSLPEIAHSIFRRFADLGLDVNVAVASNPDAALLAARGFSGVTVIPSGKEAEQLGSLPVAVLFADRDEEENYQQRTGDILETLDRWGVSNLCALAALPAIALSERLGQEGLRLQQLARGMASRTLLPVEDPPMFEEGIELEFPIVLLEPLAFLLNRLLHLICARLAARALNTQELQLTLELENFSAINQTEKFRRKLRLPLPMLDPTLFLKLLQLDLNAHPPGAPIRKVHLTAEPARPRSAQGSLFLPPSPEPEKLELTLARIASIVGESHVGSTELLDTHRPEGFRVRRFAVEAARLSSKLKHCAAAEKNSTTAALRIFRPPLWATVTLENGEPVRVICARKYLQGTVLWKAGPWRSSGDWWEREAWSRDEWDVALQNADEIALYRLVHDRLNGSWFLEGTYD